MLCSASGGPGVEVEKDIVHASSSCASGLGEICRSFLVGKFHLHNDNLQWLTVQQGRAGKETLSQEE